MPIIERDPWRRQYFEGLACPDAVVIPTDDTEAWRLFPAQRRIYDKLFVAESQGMACGPHGVPPERYPVFSKPIYNLSGMGVDSRPLRSREDYLRWERAGHLWEELLEGEHVSSDFAVVAGRVAWHRHTLGHPLAGGTFDHWVIEAEDRPGLTSYCRNWIGLHLAEYTGMVNLETLGGRIIEGHLRFSDQWPDLYGAGWLEALIGLYAAGSWALANEIRRTGYSVALFVDHGRRGLRHPPPAQLADIRARPGISSLQITFDESDPSQHAMPPGGFRVAVINCTVREAGFAARAELARYFQATKD